MKAVKRHKLPVTRQVSTRDEMCNVTDAFNYLTYTVG